MVAAEEVEVEVVEVVEAGVVAAVRRHQEVYRYREEVEEVEAYRRRVRLPLR